ncbi:hypothetical protein R9C00_12090 [Flammeovirgaceae bacterium SG7u.111]|nr:hypothetical protein [Flammeovirgaceae bacterium SG7u.132]WPO38193.1 hypothetical protein R9C00_12090 [Flammeovirgaceae bacterium SG7u.111]
MEVKLTRLVKFIPFRHKNISNLDYNLKINLVEKTVAQKLEQFYFPTKEDTITSELIERKLADYLEGTEKQYRMNKKTNIIELVLSPRNPIYPSLAMEPIPFKEIKD